MSLGENDCPTCRNECPDCWCVVCWNELDMTYKCMGCGVLFEDAPGPHPVTAAAKMEMAQAFDAILTRHHKVYDRFVDKWNNEEEGERVRQGLK